MRINFKWITFLTLPYVLVTSLPVPNPENHQTSVETNPAFVHQQQTYAHNIPKPDESSNDDEKIISVRITSSVAVGRSKAKSSHKGSDHIRDNVQSEFHTTTPTVVHVEPTTIISDILTTTVKTTTLEDVEIKSEVPPNLVGANLEFLKQLQAKKGIRGLNNYERLHSFNSEEDLTDNGPNQTNDSVAESSVQSIFRQEELLEEVPLARSVPLSYNSQNYIQDPPQANSRLTSINFNVVHDTPKINNYNDNLGTYINPTQSDQETQEFYNQPSKIYSQPAQIYSEPAKVYSEPAKIYSEPAKVYSEPAKVYSEPAKIYSEPAKFYSQPASLHLNEGVKQDDVPWQQKSPTDGYSSTIVSAPPTTSSPYPAHTQAHRGHEPEKNYEVDEKVSVMTDGRTHGEQPTNPENCKQENCKVGYVVEGRQFRKYRVEERTSDGFIVGEYGVVRNEDGALRGVRYTADSDASPRLIHDALMKFLQLK
ncbi:uncharacterized protein LOC112051328 [Bicyclus anynana]|uniref:Uncharacterized protein LOC112051328 n=1 Tax=Bicyclus anynana TaxID=110368 RepID=A0A6J1NL28_BICAN|nr:uncharacterized protein LOC112051328 [Bicyclus anynana]